MDESRLIQEYASSGSDDAFRGLVDQYVGLVYSACLRQLKDRHLAEDATQAVFILLSQKAGTLRQANLSGWLLTTSRYACANIRKSQQRRQRREQVVAMNQTSMETRDDDLLDLLDEALCHLKAADREALVLAYLKEQPIDDVAAKLGISPDAARKRVGRGVDKLRQYFSRRGITASSAAVGGLLTRQIPGAALAPGVRETVAQGVLQVCHAGAQSTAASVAIAKGTETMMMFAKLKTAAALAITAALIATTGWTISQAAASKAAAPQATAPPSAVLSSPRVAAAAPPAAGPTTGPSAIDLTTPNDALRSFFVAVRNGDRASAYACLTAAPSRHTTLMDAMLAWNLAQNHLVHAVTQAFGGDGAAVQRIITIDMVAFFIAGNPDGTTPAVVNGDTATITIKIPPLIAKIVPPNYQPILRKWSDKALYFHKQGEKWKFDINHSMRVVARVKDDRRQPLGSDAAIAIMTDTAQATDQIANAVDNGEITQLNAAAGALDAASSRISQHYHIGSTSFDVVPAQGN
jgi:RNA polymerase sigma factor (sigma-70 family)